MSHRIHTNYSYWFSRNSNLLAWQFSRRNV